MKKPEMASLILAMLDELLSGTGFQPKRSEDAFVKRIVGGWQMIGLPLWDYSPVFEFSLNICIRLNVVEDIFHQFSGAPRKYHSKSVTTITSLDYFTGAPVKFKVTTVGEVAIAKVALSSIIHDRIIPFFEAHHDVLSLDRAVNEQQPSIDVTQNPSGAMHGVILARLAGIRDFERVVARYQSDMQLAPDVSHPFNLLVEHLRTRTS